MGKGCVTFACLVLAIGCGGEAQIDPRLSGLVDAERSFSAASGSSGMNAAFLSFLDDDSIIFRPHPVDGKEYTAGRPEPRIRLTWEPFRVGVSSAGDLGYSTGPYTLEFDEPGEPPVRGYFVSIWKRPDGGDWKVALDLGTEDPTDAPCTERADFSRGLPGSALSDVDTVAIAEELAELEAWLSETAADRGIVEALEGRLDQDTRLYRDGHCPREGEVDVRWALEDGVERMTWNPLHTIVAESGDLGYSYGPYELRAKRGAGGGIERGYYLHVWRRESAGAWKLVLDVTSPIPEED